MVSTYERDKIHSSGIVSPVKADVALAVALWLLMALLAFVSLYRQIPPATVGASAPPLEFSSERAMKHLSVIAQRPHPMGSLEHDAVRDYIFKELAAAGLSPEIQTATAIDADANGYNRAGTTQNIIVRLRGTDSLKALMLVGHYDSVPTGPGASDDGAAVAMMLETLRALKAGAPLKSDLILLFTDGEEAALLGANAFVAEHPWSRDVGLVLNFEARGNSGPVIMFETSEQNGWLIREFAKAAPYPISHSLAYEIYRLLPNDTDLTVFKRAGLAGLNFAYINGLQHYHTQLDSLSEIDQRSLQHQGSYALALARHFGGLSLENTARPNAVYFDLMGLTLVHYSSAWVLPLSLLVLILFAWLVVYGLRRGRLSLKGILLGFLAFLCSLIVAPLFVTLLWSLIQRFQDVPGMRPQGEAYNNELYLLSFAAFAVAITAALYSIFGRKVGVEDMAVGGLLWWLLLLLVTVFYVPGASYLLTWPLLFSLLALGYLLTRSERGRNSLWSLLLLAVGAAPGIILLAPTIQQTFIGLTLSSIGVVIALVVLLLGLLIPHLAIMNASRRWLLPGVTALSGLGLLLFVIAESGYSARHPRLDTMLYELNADNGQAMWASSDRKLDNWTSQFLSANVKQRPLTEVFSPGTSRQFWEGQAAVQPLAAPIISVLNDTTENGVRSLRLRATSARQAPVLSVYLESKAEVLRSDVNGRQIASANAPASNHAGNHWELRYYAVPDDGIEISLNLKAAEPVKLRIVDQTYGLPLPPDTSLALRPSDVIPSPLPYNDSTFVSKSFTLGSP